MIRRSQRHICISVTGLGFSPGVRDSSRDHSGAPEQISPAGTGHHWFTSIVSAPDDARHIMACGMRQTPRQNSWQGFVYASHDGGLNWAVALVDSETQSVSEETRAFGSNGAAYSTDRPIARCPSRRYLYRPAAKPAEGDP